MHKRIINLILYKKFKHVKISSSVCIKHKRLPNRQFYTGLHQLPAQSKGPFRSLRPKAKSFPPSVGSTNLQNQLTELGNNETTFFNKVHHCSTTSEVTGCKTVAVFLQVSVNDSVLKKKKRKEKQTKQNEQDSIFGRFYISLLITSHHKAHDRRTLAGASTWTSCISIWSQSMRLIYRWGGKKKKNQTARVGIIRHTNQDRFEDSWEITKDRMTQSVWMHSTADSADSAGHY